MKPGDHYQATQDCLNNFRRGQAVEITQIENGRVIVDNVAVIDTQVFLQFFRPVDSSPAAAISGEDKIRLAITALINGTSVELPDGEVWIYRRQGETVQEQEDGDIIATRSNIFRRMTVLKRGYSFDQFLGVDGSFGYVVEQLRGISDDQAALLAGNLALRKTHHSRG